LTRHQPANRLPDCVAIVVGESVRIERTQPLERCIVLDRRKLGDNLEQLTPPKAVFTYEYEEFGGSETYAECIVPIGNPRVHVWRPVPPLRACSRHSHSVKLWQHGEQDVPRERWLLTAPSIKHCNSLLRCSRCLREPRQEDC